MSYGFEYCAYGLCFLAVLVLIRTFFPTTARGSKLAFLAANLAAFTCYSANGFELKKTALCLAAYAAILLTQFFLVKKFAASDRSGRRIAIPFLYPLLVMIFFKTVRLPINPFLLGLSYLAFRLSYLAFEARNGAVANLSLLDYSCYVFYFPLMFVGPIQRCSAFLEGFNQPEPRVAFGASKIIMGGAKYFFLSNILSHLAYDGLLFDGHYHASIDLLIAAYSYFLFLYFNFSGFCDIVIGFSALIGIETPENFTNPFSARNIREFWSRWHITLGDYLRDMVFTPLSKVLIRKWGAKRAHHAMAVAIAAVFIAIGLWHGFAWNFLVFGMIHALGCVVNHYYGFFLRKRLGPLRFKAYLQSKPVHGLGVFLTLNFMVFSLFFFANDFSRIREILHVLRMG